MMWRNRRTTDDPVVRRLAQMQASIDAGFRHLGGLILATKEQLLADIAAQTSVITGIVTLIHGLKDSNKTLQDAIAALQAKLDAGAPNTELQKALDDADAAVKANSDLLNSELPAAVVTGTPAEGQPASAPVGDTAAAAVEAAGLDTSGTPTSTGQ